VGLARGDKEQVLPFKGLNTESNLLHFPQEFSPDLLNMEAGYTPNMVRPRKGVSISGLERLADTRPVNDHDVAISSFLWESVDSDPDKNFICVQVGRYLYFFDDGGILDPTTNVHSERVDLNDLLSGTSLGTLANLEKTRLNYTNVKGKLLIASRIIDPTLIQYDATTVAISISKLALKMRDILGVSDGLEIDERPAALTDDHKYNLLNQGWYKQRRLTSGSGTQSDPIVQYNTINGEYPANSDIVWVGMVDSAGDLIFDAEWLRDQTFGSTPAPKGHYVVDIFNIDRGAVITTPTSSGNTSSGSAPSGGSGSGPIGSIYPPAIILP